MWRIKKSGKVKRVLAAWLGICMVLQLMVGTAAPFSVFASGTPVDMLIRIKESEIRNKVKSPFEMDEEDSILDEKKIPFKGEQLERAVEKLDEIIGTATIIKQGSIKNDCSFIVAASAESDDEDAVIDQIMLIGLNGNKKQKCNFKLEIVDEGGIVIKSVSVTGYSLDGDFDDEATPPEASGSDTDLPIATASVAGKGKKATGSDAASGSDAATGSDADGKEFTEYFNDAFSREQINGLVKRKNQEAAESPHVVGKPRSIVVVSADGVNSVSANGKIAKINVYAESEPVKTGGVTTFHVDADYSAVDKDFPQSAYFMIKFTAANIGSSDAIRGPEKDKGAQDVETLTGQKKTEWEELSGLLEENGILADDWKLITVEQNHYYYSEQQMVAAMSLQNDDDQGGSSIVDLPIRFTLRNGITWDGAEIEAEPGILNAKQLIEIYAGKHPSLSEEEVNKKLIVGDPVKVQCEAEFKWEDVTRTCTDSLGIVKDAKLTYSYSTHPVYSAAQTMGVLFTAEYEVLVELDFQGFAIEGLTGAWEIKNNNLGTIYLVGGNGSSYPLIETNLSGIKAEDINISFSKAGNGAVTGIQLKYKVKNNTLNNKDITPVDLQLNNGNELKLTLDFTKTADLIAYTAAAQDSVPKIQDKITFKAYSEMFQNGQDEKYYHESSANGLKESEKKYALKKTTLVKDPAVPEGGQDKWIEANGNQKVLAPGEELAYRFEVTNNGYAVTDFKIFDKMPAGIDYEEGLLSLPGSDKTVKTDSEWRLKGGNLEIPVLGVEPGETRVIEWTAAYDNKPFKLISDKKEFEEHKISTNLTNNAELYYLNADINKQNLLGKDDTSVFVKLDALTKEEFSIKKTIDNKDTIRTVGNAVTFKVTAQLEKKVKYPQRITMFDHWPNEMLSLTKVGKIPSGGTVILRDSEGGELARFTNEGSGAVEAAANDQFKTPAGKKMSQAQIEAVKEIEMSFDLQPGKGHTIEITGNIKNSGVLQNTADAPGIEGGTASVTAIGMSIEKKAYHINGNEKKLDDSNSLTTPVAAGITFKNGDIVCYEVKVKNLGDGETLVPLIKDDVSELFKGAGITDFSDFVKADLTDDKGQDALIYYKKEGSKNPWKSAKAPMDGKIEFQVSEEEALVKKNDTFILRFYIRIPENTEEHKVVINEAQTYNNTATATVSVPDGAGRKDCTIQASASISTIYYGEQWASIEKEVLAVGRKLVKNQTYNTYQLEHAKWNHESIVEGAGYVDSKDKLTVGKGDYVFYKITINNDSDTPLKIYEVQDWLPEGMEIRNFYEFNISTRGQIKPVDEKNRLDKTSDTLSIGNTAWAIPVTNSGQKWIYYTDASNGNFENAAVASIRNHSSNSSISSDGSVYRLRLYGKDLNGNVIPTIKPNKSVTYGVLAEVTGSVKMGDDLTNTTGVTIEKDVKSHNPERSTDGLDAVGGKQYSSDSYKIITAQAQVKTARYTPGIEKQLSQYSISGDWYTYDPENPNENFAPTDWMRWQVKLHNGINATPTQGVIKEYTLKDTLPLGLTYNKDDTVNKIANEAGQSVTLPAPAMSGGNGKPVVLTWKIRLNNGTYQIIGADASKPIETKVDLSIPVRGSITVMIATKAEGNTAKYGTYVNRADLIVNQDQYPYVSSCIGELNKQDGAIESIFATAQVDIYGSGRTEAWKEISARYDGLTDETSGRNTSNYIMGESEGIATYRLNVTNRMSGGTMKDLVLIDRLPRVGDTGLINNSPRQSDFEVNFTGDNIVVELKSSSGTKKLKSSDYDVKYGNWYNMAADGDALPDEYWDPGNDSGWEKSYSGKDCIRIKISEDVMKKVVDKDTITVTFKVKLPDAASLDSAEEAIAWNTFGYAYGLSTVGERRITVEPAKVGIQLGITELNISKLVDSPNEQDKNESFRFHLERRKDSSSSWEKVKDAAYKVTSLSTPEEGKEGSTDQAGEFTLSHNETARFILPSNYQYRVSEVIPEQFGFVVKASNFSLNSEAPVNYQSVTEPLEPEAGKVYSCTFTNIKDILTLPETGGEGTGAFHFAGAAMMMMALLMLAGYYLIQYFGVRRKGEEQ